MKKFIKKIGNKKYCLLSLLLAGILLFAIVGGLNGYKSPKTEVNAITAPTTKNLDLNGVRYTYQTSLNELKTNYNFFKYFYYVNLFSIVEDTEGLVTYQFLGQKSNITQTDSEINNNLALIKDNVKFYDNNNKIVENDLTLEANYNKQTNKTLLDSATLELSTIRHIEINFFNLFYGISNIDNEYFRFPDNEHGGKGFMMYFCYLDTKNNNNIINYAYAFNEMQFSYKFTIPYYKNYSLRHIECIFYDEQESRDNCINIVYPRDIKTRSVYDGRDIFIDNLNFIENSNAITFNFDIGKSTGDTYEYKGNILLSETKYDKDMYDYITTRVTPTGVNVNFGTTGFWGGKFNENKASGNAFYRVSSFGNGLVCYNEVVNIIGPAPINNLFIILNNKISYKNQNRLLFLNGASDLRATYNNVEYSALSAQVEDILYNVGFVGDIQEIEFNEKVQDDFIDLLKTTGFGAFIGLLIGFLVGNPLVGLIVGAVIGFAVAIVPLLIDALQAIFGYDFLSGLYNFFNAITEFFVNLVDTIINFLLSIITNPFVLILIVIVAIIYIFVKRNNK